MSDRFARFYQPMDRFDFLTLVDHWSTYGITLQNPHTHRVTAISVEGDQVETSPDLLKVTFSNSSPITFQLWLNEDTDVTSSIRFLSSHRVVEEYELDGLLESEMDRVLEIIVARFKLKAVETADLFLVIDREGYTIDLDWDQLSAIGRYDERICPDVLAMPAVRSVDFRSCIKRNSVLVQVGSYLLMRTPSRTEKVSKPPDAP
ncbi:MAG TPA: hypothetical protein VFS77_16915 [Pyrinomonadaceae bacterium]|nr:hypothetical protein [Pyrinomonadaceae bacterium]